MFKVTARAAEQVRVAAREGGTEGLALRLAASRKPDGSLDYQMGFDERSEADIHVETEGIEVVIAEAHRELLHGTVMDFVELEPGDWRFIFMNPNDANYSPPKGEAPA